MIHRDNVLENIVGSQLGESTVSMLLEDLGMRYRCERIYIFYKDEKGRYDCTDEWVNAHCTPKKDLLQNLSDNTVKPYHDYFAQFGKLIVRDLEMMQESDPSLYQMLKAQGLTSLLVGPLMYEGIEVGFIGIDNPQVERFEELEALFPIIMYVVSIQKHRQEIQSRILNPDFPEADHVRNKKSMYDRAAELKKGIPLGIAYCSLVPTGERTTDSVKREETYVSHVLNSIFDYRNVFALGKGEFLVIAEHSAEQDMYDLQYFISQAKKTLSVINIHLSSGIVFTDSYKEDFFDMINTADAYMQRDIRKFRDFYVGKYHFQTQTHEFLDLIEIRPSEDTYQVVYSEHLDNRIGFQGNWSEFYPKLLDTIIPADKRRFIAFWNSHFPLRADISLNEYQKAENFHFKLSDGEEIGIEMHLTHYLDINDEQVLMCYTK